MNDLAKMSIDKLQELLSKDIDPANSSPIEAVLQSKCIQYLSSEIAIFKEALSTNVSNLNGTIGLTNRNIRELRDSINDSTSKIIESNKKLARSQSFNSWIMVLLTLLLVIVGFSQAIIMVRQSNIMDKQTKIMGWQLENVIPKTQKVP